MMSSNIFLATTCAVSCFVGKASTHPEKVSYSILDVAAAVRVPGDLSVGQRLVLQILADPMDLGQDFCAVMER